MNSAKLFIHPQGGYLLETQNGNFHVTNENIMVTFETSEGMEESVFDITLQSTFDNAKRVSANILNESEIALLELLVIEKMEDFD